MISTTDTLWLLLGTVLVFFMQAGFAMVETGFTRAKNAGNIIMKNLLDFACGSIVFWIFGFGLMYGANNGFIGWFDPFITKDYIGAGCIAGNVPQWATVMFQTVFCATSATIVSGAMAERTKFKSYLIYSILISAVIYPIEGHWIWGGGWLSSLNILGWEGFTDFAGSTAVHMTGGLAALVGAKILGPRIGKYDANGKPKAILGHSLTLGALGVFILWFGWFGFNPASTLGIDGLENAASLVFMTTNIAAACATVAALAVTWIRYKKPDISMTLNGSLAGLVAITAGCEAMDPWAAAIVGTLAGVLVVLAIEFIEKVCKIDDPVGAVGVHCVCGAFGTICVGLFARDGGLFTTGQWGRLLVQLTGVVAVTVFVVICMIIIFEIIKHTIGLRASKEEEIRGLDIGEHGLASSYADFVPMPETVGAPAVYAEDEKDVSWTGGTSASPMAPMAPDVIMSPADGKVDEVVAAAPSAAEDLDTEHLPITKVDILLKQSKFEALKDAMFAIGITGMTVTQVLGCGMQGGAPEYYRGAPVDTNLLPKVKVEIVVCKVPVRLVIETAQQVLRTGHIGDGKIFVSKTDNVIKIRTGEEGYDALQDVE